MTWEEMGGGLSIRYKWLPPSVPDFREVLVRWRLVHKPQKEDAPTLAILETQFTHSSLPCAPPHKPPVSWGLRGSKGWSQGGLWAERKVFIPIHRLHPPAPDLAGLRPDWGSGRGIWDRRRRGGAVSSQSLLLSRQERAEAEGREVRQLAVGLGTESLQPSLPAGPLSLTLSHRPRLSLYVSLQSLPLPLFLVSISVSFFIAVSWSLPFVSTCTDLCLLLRLLWLGAQ